MKQGGGPAASAHAAQAALLPGWRPLASSTTPRQREAQASGRPPTAAGLGPSAGC